MRYIQNQMLLERNPAWDPAPIRFARPTSTASAMRLGVDPQLQQLQIEAGTADLGVEPLRADVGPMLAIDDPRCGCRHRGTSMACTSYVLVNHLGPNNAGALRKREVRRAISLAADRAARCR